MSRRFGSSGNFNLSTSSVRQPASSSDLVHGGAGGGTSPTRTGSLAHRATSSYRNSSDGVAAALGSTTSPTRSGIGSRQQRLGSPSRTTSSVGAARTSSFHGSLHSSSASQQQQPQQDASSSPVPYSCTVLASAGKSTSKPIQLTYGSGCVQGHRPTMEDAHFNLVNAKTVGGHPVSLFGILDGHCGKHVADLGAQILPDTVMTHSQLGQNGALALVESIAQTDRQIFQRMGQQDGGSTLICAMVFNRMLLIANLGDARAVLCEGGNTIAMSIDHKPSDPVEQHRVAKCGGFVHFGRVGGCLAVSRALGDYEFKFTGNRFVQKEFQVSNIADIRQINITDSTRFIILACDGLWDVLASEEAVAWVNQYLVQRGGEAAKQANFDLSKLLTQCSQALCEYAIAKGSMDNVSVTIIMFHAAF